MSAAKPTKQERWRARNPLADWCHAATRSALRRGLIKRRPCKVCGAEPAEAHHPDNGWHQPLVVEFLCARHHRATYRKAKRGNGK